MASQFWNTARVRFLISKCCKFALASCLCQDYNKNAKIFDIIHQNMLIITHCINCHSPIEGFIGYSYHDFQKQTMGYPSNEFRDTDNKYILFYKQYNTEQQHRLRHTISGSIIFSRFKTKDKGRLQNNLQSNQLLTQKDSELHIPSPFTRRCVQRERHEWCTQRLAQGKNLKQESKNVCDAERQNQERLITNALHVCYWVFGLCNN